MFKKAEKKQSKLKICLSGPSGSGKTFSALTLATGVGEKIALVDTENKSSALYADFFNFDLASIESPYTTQRYIDAMKFAENAGYDVLVIDSISHQWVDILDQKAKLDSRGGNSFANWKTLTPEHERFKAAILQSKCHVICTMRSKQEHVLVTENGKSQVKRVGMAGIQRDGVEYEFDLVFDLGFDHTAQATKDRTSLFQDQLFRITSDTGRKLIEWVNTGVPIPEAPIPQTKRQKIVELAQVKNLPLKSVAELLEKQFGVKNADDLSDDQFESVKETLKAG